jgi:hypothetical protein
MAIKSYYWISWGTQADVWRAVCITAYMRALQRRKTAALARKCLQNAKKLRERALRVCVLHICALCRVNFQAGSMRSVITIIIVITVNTQTRAHTHKLLSFATLKTPGGERGARVSIPHRCRASLLFPSSCALPSAGGRVQESKQLHAALTTWAARSLHYRGVHFLHYALVG